MFERDPEELGGESYADVELRMDMQASIHRFDPDPATGRCRGYLIRHGVRGADCGSTQASSVFHDRDEDPRAQFEEGGAHWHGGGDCMCFEGDE